MVKMGMRARWKASQLGDGPVAAIEDAETRRLLERYVGVFDLAGSPLAVTTERALFEGWLGRRVDAAIGGAYVFDRRRQRHAILINLRRIDRSKPKALEIVVAEELMHMRNWIDGDRRRHAKHGYDRIAHRVAALTGASLEEVRSCLLPRERRPVRYLYRCPGCARTIERRRKGTWSCACCSPTFDPRFVLRLERDLRLETTSAATPAAGSDPSRSTGTPR
jgi:predicted SprT family Zn-dependent metalloprotease